MFDLALFRNHTFDGGAIAAFGLSASLFALLLYIVSTCKMVRATPPSDRRAAPGHLAGLMVAAPFPVG